MKISLLQVVLVVCAAVPLLHSQKKDADEARPYEFGFTIDGQQHRHEKKGALSLLARTRAHISHKFWFVPNPNCE